MRETPSISPQQHGASDAPGRSRSRTVPWLMIVSVLLALMSLLTSFPLMSIGSMHILALGPHGRDDVGHYLC